MVEKSERQLKFFLVHPGGPYHVNKNEGAWSIAKGLIEDGEALLSAAKREFKEETGIEPIEPFYSLGAIKMKSGKSVHAWAFEGTWSEAEGITCNTFELEWPPRSGKKISIPEVDRASWMDYEMAKVMIIPAQAPFLDRAKELFST